MRSNIVILDRDGVINEDSTEHVRSTEDWKPIDGSIEAIALLKQKHLRVFVATNQSGIARGLFDENQLEAIHNRMREVVETAGGAIEGIVYCPHDESDKCDCRKPRPGLLRQIEHLTGESIKGCPFVGDSLRDIEAARAGGCEPILVMTGNGAKTQEAVSDSVRIFKNLSEFAQNLLVRHPS